MNNSHLCEFRHRLPLNSAQLLQIKGDVTLESAQVYPGGMGGSMGFPHMGGHMPFGQPPQVSFNPGSGYNPGSGFTPGFGFPSAPPVIPTPSFPVGLFF